MVPRPLPEKSVQSGEFYWMQVLLQESGKREKTKSLKKKSIDYTPIQNTKLGRKIIGQGSTSTMWALIMVNLVSNPNVPTSRWFIENCNMFQTYEEDDLFNLLIPVFANDEKGHGKQNVCVCQPKSEAKGLQKVSTCRHQHNREAYYTSLRNSSA